jgi:sugar lactone lactonase YvrE
MPRVAQVWSGSLLFRVFSWVAALTAILVPPAIAIELVTKEPAATAAHAAAVGPGADAEPAAILETPSHRQVAIIQANVSGQPQTTLTCFSLAPDDRILAGCAGETGEIRVFDSAGKHLESWSLPIKPEAIFARPDGAIFVAGGGEVAQLTKEGKLALQKRAPHAASLKENPEQLREQIVAQHKQRADMILRQTEQFDQMIERSDKEIASIKEQLAQLEERDSDKSEAADDAGSDRTKPAGAAQRKKMLERRMAMHEQRKSQYEAVKKQWGEMAKQNPPTELTEEQIQAQIQASIAHKLKASSISATADEVFLATPASAGYGFEIWRMDNQFENATKIVSELRGCCGQMDVKVNDNGVYVAENARHRVCRYDREGTLVGTWGQSARTGLEGFGSCCNPMNVAFGPDNVVYTAEDNTGRIKRYSPEGNLLGLVGSVDVVPGCKNVSIAVNHDGSQVYMLDITRNHIVRMDEQPAGEIGPVKAEKKTAADAEAEDSQAPAATTTTRMLVVPRTSAVVSARD